MNGPGERRRTRVLVVSVALVAALLLTLAVAGLVRRQSARTSPAAPSATVAVELLGMQTTPPPWLPEYDNLQQRMTALGLPPVGDTYLLRAHLAVFVDGERVRVPVDVGISNLTGLTAPMHTHNSSGVISVDAAAPSDTFTLGAFFDVWGVVLSPTQLGGFVARDDSAVTVHVNGEPIENARAHVFGSHDDIVVAYGVAGSSPTTDPHTWGAGE